MLDVSLGSPRQHRSLDIFPLLSSGAPDLPFDLLVDAVASGLLTIGEVGEGTVPTLIAKNAGERAVLVLDGEQLIGARQNRMTNRSILLPARSSTEIPVYCMEQGRWRFESDVMTPSPQHSPAKVRRRAREAEARHAAAGADASVNMLRHAQGEVWSDVAETLHAFEADSATHSLDAAYAAAHEMTDWLASFPCEPGQVGLLAFVAGVPLGVDVIGAPRLYARLHQRLLRGYVLDALEHERRHRPASPASSPLQAGAQHYLDSVRTAERTEAPSVGIGRYCVLRGPVVGGELLHAGRVAHLSAFPACTTGWSGGVPSDDVIPVAPPSHRRRRS